MESAIPFFVARPLRANTSATYPAEGSSRARPVGMIFRSMGFSETGSERQAGEVAALHGGVVLGSDTIVELRGRVFGKPRDEREACRMLRSLSGGVHRVHTGVCVTGGPAAKSFVSTAEVEFYPLSDRMIEAYVRTGDPMDKAGAYGIQGPGCVLVKRINGDFYTIMGLPAAETARLLGSFGIFPSRR